MSKKKFQVISGILLSMVLILSINFGANAQSNAPADQNVVRAVLFFSQACGHCEYVRTEIFPPLYEQYNSQLEIFEIDISTEAGYILFGLVMQNFEVPVGSQGVPFLVIEDSYLVGSADIPNIFPGLIATELEGDGTNWPKIPEILEFIEESSPPTIAAEAEPTPIEEEAQEIEPTPSSTFSPRKDEPETPLYILRFQQDLTGNSVSVVVLLGMVIAVIYTGIVFMRTSTLKLWPWWITPILIVIGFVVATYLSVIEVSGGEAICGPVGDCNAVQSSSYARLFGIIHIGVFGMIGYVMILLAWTLGRWGKDPYRSWGNMAAFLFSVFGTLFSIYLTFLEPFVIGATCMWCITSAITMTLLMLNTTPVALDLWMEYDFDEDIFEDED